MDLSDRENDLFQFLSGTTKSALACVPGLGQAIAGYDAYKRSSFDRNLLKAIQDLQEKVDDLENFFDEEWIKTKEGNQFARKVFDCAFDEQLADKQELFINALINGVRDRKTEYIEKLKFIDILRQLSRASLMILAEMHKKFTDQVRRPDRHVDPISPFPQVDTNSLAEKLSDEIYTPYLISSAISEMDSQGLFSSVGEWKKDHSGQYRSSGGFNTAMCYTDFTAKFVEFILIENQ